MQAPIYDLILEEIKKGENGNEFYSLDYPNHKEALTDFFEKHNNLIKEENIAEVGQAEINIDEDGYPYVRTVLCSEEYNIKVTIIAYHHLKWDFYFENINLL